MWYYILVMFFNRKYLLSEHITILSNFISKSKYQSNGTVTWWKKKKNKQTNKPTQRVIQSQQKIFKFYSWFKLLICFVSSNGELLVHQTVLYCQLHLRPFVTNPRHRVHLNIQSTIGFEISTKIKLISLVA